MDSNSKSPSKPKDNNEQNSEAVKPPKEEKKNEKLSTEPKQTNPGASTSNNVNSDWPDKLFETVPLPNLI